MIENKYKSDDNFLYKIVVIKSWHLSIVGIFLNSDTSTCSLHPLTFNYLVNINTNYNVV